MTSALVSEFALVFAVILGLEFLDRTNFALIGLAARQPAGVTWLGASGGFVAVTALAVVIGSALLAVLGGHVNYLRVAGGVFLLGYAAYYWHSSAREEDGFDPRGRGSAALTAFLLIFVLELGDTTMIFAVLFVGSTGNALLVFAAASLALVTVAATGCFIGHELGRRIDPRRMRPVVLVILVAVAVVTILYGLFPGAFASL